MKKYLTLIVLTLFSGFAHATPEDGDIIIINGESIFNIDVDFSDSLMPQSSMELSFSTSNFTIDE